MNTCSICQGQYSGHGNNAQPVNDGRCCGECNLSVVVPARIRKDANKIAASQKEIICICGHNDWTEFDRCKNCSIYKNQVKEQELLEECPFPEKHADGDSHHNCENVNHLTPAAVAVK